jgi:hypothetical protein
MMGWQRKRIGILFYQDSFLKWESERNHELAGEARWNFILLRSFFERGSELFFRKASSVAAVAPTVRLGGRFLSVGKSFDKTRLEMWLLWNWLLEFEHVGQWRERRVINARFRLS